MWQDWVITVGQFLFLVALIPSIRSAEKPALGTSLMTGIILTIFAVAQFTLGLYFSVVSAITISIGWYILAWQSYKKRQNINLPKP